MESLEDIEKALSKLVPSAISEKGQQSLEDLIDSLAVEAGEEPNVVEMPEPEPVTAAPKRRVWSWAGGIGAAAAAVVISLTVPMGTPEAQSLASHTNPNVVPAAHNPEKGGLLLLDEVERVEAAEPEDWISEADGEAHRAWRYRVVNEQRVQDVETGYEVTVSCPGEKVVLRPVLDL